MAYPVRRVAAAVAPSVFACIERKHLGEVGINLSNAPQLAAGVLVTITRV